MDNKERNLIISLASAVLHFQPCVCSPERENAIAHIRKLIATLSSSETEGWDTYFTQIQLTGWVEDLVRIDQLEAKTGDWLLPTDTSDPLPDDLTDAVIKAFDQYIATHCTTVHELNRIFPLIQPFRGLVQDLVKGKHKLQRDGAYNIYARRDLCEMTLHPATLPADLLDPQTIHLYTKLYMFNKFVINKLKKLH